MAQRRSKSFLDQVRKLGPGLLVSGATLFTPPAISADAAIDAVGNALVDSATIDFTYDPIGKTITAGTINGVTAGAVLTDNAIVRGDGGARGVQTSGITIADTTSDLTTPGSIRWTGPVSSNVANSGAVDFTSGARLISWGANTSSLGVIDFYQATSNGLGASGSKARITANSIFLVNTTTETGSAGRLQIGINTDTTAAGGICLGTDVQMHRSEANVLTVPDTVRITGTVHPAAGSLQGVYLNNSSGGFVGFADSSRTANNRLSAFQFASGILMGRFFNDAINAAVNWVDVTGGQAAGISLVAFPSATAHVVGHSASVTVGNAGKLQVAGATAAAAQAQVSGYAADATTAGTIALSKSRNATNGSNTIVQSGDVVGRIIGYGADGTNYDAAAQISFEVDGTPGSGTDMPGRIVLSTSPDASATLTEALRVDSAQKTIFQVDRAVRFNNQTSAAAANAGTLGNAPTAGDPGYWLKINIGGTNYAIPAWAG